MTARRWERVKEVYESLAEATAGERARCLAALASEDPDLHAQVAEMLAVRTAASSFFEHRPLLGSGLAPIRAGDLLADRFRIVRQIGAGGMGQVYEACDEASNARRTLAIKLLGSFDVDLLPALKNEFRSLTGILHPNLVTLYELFCADEQWFFTMELLNGRYFTDYVRDRRFLSRQDSGPLRTAFAQVVDGLNALHQVGKIHCDLKPSNILVDEDCNVTILDFGLARELAPPAWRAGTALAAGTLRYMSPEHMRGDALSPATDWYAAGILLYEAVANRLPFDGDFDTILRRKASQDCPPPRTVCPDAPEDLSDLSMKLLNSDASQRPNIAEIRDLLGDGFRSSLRIDPLPFPDRSFVGRGYELATLDRAFGDLCSGRGFTVIIEAASGVGKTALAEKFLGGASASGGALIFSGKCYEQENVPYKALDAIVDAIHGYLTKMPPLELARTLPASMPAIGRLFPVFRSVPYSHVAVEKSVELDDLEVRTKAFVGFIELLRSLGRNVPLVLFIDDLQWGDIDSAMLLAELIQSAPAVPALLVLAMRSEYADTSKAGALLTKALENASCIRLPLEPLGTDDARELARNLVGRTGLLADRISLESQGNPYYLRELARVERQGPLGSAGVESGSIDGLVWKTATGLTAIERKLVELLAVSGKPIRYSHACAAVAVDGSDPRLLLALRSVHLVRSFGAAGDIEVDVYHDRVREAIVTRLASDVRRDYHFQIALELDGSEAADDETVATHFEQGGDSRRAGNLYARAAERVAGVLAFDRAASLCAKALRLGDFSPRQRSEVTAQMATALANSGRCAEAAQTYERALQDSSKDRSRFLQRSAAYNYCVSGQIERGRECYGRLLREMGMRLPSSPWEAVRRLAWARLRLRLIGLSARGSAPGSDQQMLLDLADAAWTAATGLAMVDVLSGAVFTTEGLLLALKCGDSSRIARSLLWEAVIRGVSTEGRRSARRFFEAATARMQDNPDDPYLAGLHSLSAGFQSYQRCRFQPALRQFAVAECLFRDKCRGAIWEATTARHQRIHATLLIGEYCVLAEELPRIRKDAADKGDLYSLTTLAVFPEAMDRLRDGHPEGALAVIAEGLAQWPQDGMTFQKIQSIMAQGWIYMYMGEPLEALRAVAGRWKELKRTHVFASEMHRLAFLDLRCRASLAVAARSPNPGMLAAAERDLRRLHRESLPIAHALADSAQGSLHCIRGSINSALDLFQRAHDAFREMDLKLFATATRRASGLLIGGDQGRTIVREADDWFERQRFANGAAMADACVPLPQPK